VENEEVENGTRSSFLNSRDREVKGSKECVTDVFDAVV
jgi:hypothetical protein